MKRVSFNVAKALKEAGYPQNFNTYYFDKEGNTWEYSFAQKNELDFNMLYSMPTYMEVWLWLWREKKRVIEPTHCREGWMVPIFGVVGFYNDPEDAIIAAIELLVECNRIK